MKPAMLKSIGLALVGLLLSIGTVSAQPVLSLSEKSFDFGYVPQNSKVAHVFWLHNTGDQDLKITKVTPGCGCTQAPLDKDLVPPGDSARLEIIFSTRLYYNYVSKSPVVECEGMDKPVSVTIASYVIPRPDSARPLVLEPFKLDFSQMGDSVRDRAGFAVTNRSNDRLKLTVIDGAEAYGLLKLPASVGPGETVQGELVLKPEALAGALTESFTFQVDDAYKSRYTVPVRRKVRDPRVGELVAPRE